MENNIKERNRIFDDLFTSLNAEEKEAIEKILIWKSVARHETVVAEGQICHYMVYVIKGLLRQFYHKNGREITEHFTCEGNIAYCIESIFKNRPSALAMSAIENSELCMIPYSNLVRLSREYPGIAEWLRLFLENNLILHQRKADSWRFESAQERYERFLVEFPTVANRASVNDIASYLLMTPESLSRVRSSVNRKKR